MKTKILITAVFCIFLFSCKKFVEVDLPPNLVADEIAFTNDVNAIAVVTGMYARMAGNIDETTYPALSSDEMRTFSGIAATNAYTYYFFNNIPLIGSNGARYSTPAWARYYNIIYGVNVALEQLNKSTTLTPAVKNQLMGEVRFLRAFSYFYLVNLYGDVPMPLISDYQLNRELYRLPKLEVYSQMVVDLNEAIKLLSSNYLDGKLLGITTERVRPTSWAAKALLARIYLYMASLGQNDKWAPCESLCSEVISSANFNTSNTPLNNVFLKNSSETIWSMQPVSNNFNTLYGYNYALPSSGPTASFPIYAFNPLVDSFDAGDDRKEKWLSKVTVSGQTYYYPSKYKAGLISSVNGIYPAPTEYNLVLRLAEQYLIRAEARIQQGKISGSDGGIADLNLIRTRARATPTSIVPNPLPNLDMGLSKDQALKAVLRERQNELFVEWGNRWFDLKRTGNINAVMSDVASLKGVVWKTEYSLYPIPLDQVERTPVTQNPGY